jgi:opacity protein-like surface antigen
MKRKFGIGVLSAIVAGSATAEGLYYVGSEAQESMPLKWVIGANFTYDDNITPLAGSDSSFSVNPYIGVSLVSITPQTTVDLYARRGVIYYFDEPSAAGSDDVNGQGRLGLNITHRFSERLRLSSRNFVAYELEPDYAYGVATTRQAGEYLHWQTDNSLGFRWTERFATYTGFQLTGLNYDDVDNADRFTWMLYNQSRYQLSPQSVLTFDVRHSETEGDGLASDSDSQFFLAGIEHRFSPSTILIARAGVQFRDVDNGDSSTSPHVEIVLNTRVNEQFNIRSFARYSYEVYDTVQTYRGAQYDFSERATLRLGVSAEYALSDMISIFGGMDYIPVNFDQGNLVQGPPGSPTSVTGLSEDLINLYIGVSFRVAENFYTSLSYNYTDSSSDLRSDYDRNRINLGVRFEF